MGYSLGKILRALDMVDKNFKLCNYREAQRLTRELHDQLIMYGIAAIDRDANGEKRYGS